MEIKQLKTFSMVAKVKSFSTASKMLGYAQPTVTTHIQSLESELSIRLFERLGHKIKLTQQGERLLYYTENILKYSDEAIADLSLNGSMTGKITIGANESFSVARLPSIFKHLIKQYPELEINLKFGSVDEIHEYLQNNSVDVAFFLTRQITFQDLVVETLIVEQLVVIASPEHPFCLKKNITINDFENQILILTQKNCTFRAMIDDLIKLAEVHLRSTIEINNIEAIKQLVMSGLGISIMPRISVLDEIEKGLLSEITWDCPQLPVSTQVAYHKDKWLSPIILNFLQEIKEFLI